MQDQPHQNQAYDNEYDNKSTSSTESEEETKLVEIINDKKGYESNESKNDTHKLNLNTTTKQKWNLNKMKMNYHSQT